MAPTNTGYAAVAARNTELARARSDTRPSAEHPSGCSIFVGRFAGFEVIRCSDERIEHPG